MILLQNTGEKLKYSNKMLVSRYLNPFNMQCININNHLALI